jgi:aminoglycoside phosphotransferase (APT) family kinase protein
LKGGAALTPASTVHDASLRCTVERALGGARGRPVRVAALRREPSPYTTLFPAEILTVSLNDGRHMSLFLKSLGSQQADHPDKARRDREILVYERLFANERLPVPRYFGASQDRLSGHCSVLLEHVDAWNLKYHELSRWPAVAHRLAELHAHFAASPRLLAKSDFLISLDARYREAWCARARSVLRTHCPEGCRHLELALQSMSQVGRVLDDQRRTLVHNDLSPKNVLVEHSAEPPQVFIVDWELAGVGCGFLDLVHLTYGLQERDEQELLSAYCEGLSAGGYRLPAGRELQTVIAASQLVKTIYRLARSSAWGLDAGTMLRWAREAEELSRNV